MYHFTPHPRTILLPDLTEKDYAALMASIRDHGLQHPIKVLTGTKLLLDGRHRLKALRELERNVEVEEVTIAEEDVPIYTGAEAATRPGLTPSQKVVLAIRLLPEYQRRAAERRRHGTKLSQGEEQGAATRLAASLVGVSPTYVKLGIALQRDHPERFKRVESGTLKLFKATREMEDLAEGKGAKKKPENKLWIPNSLRKRLEAVTEAIGVDVPGEGVGALLEFIEGDGPAPRWWVRGQATAPH